MRPFSAADGTRVICINRPYDTCSTVERVRSPDRLCERMGSSSVYWLAEQTMDDELIRLL